MFKNFLVPLDGSKMAESVLPVVAWLATIFQSRIILIHVIEKDAPPEIHGELHLTNPAQAKDYLEKIAVTAFSPDLKVESHVHSTEIKSVAESIVDHLSEFGLDLVVMCSHGRGGARDLLFGSIAQQVVSLGTVPVLLIPSAGQPQWQPVNWERILVPLNEDPQHAISVPVAAALARSFTAEVYMLMVIPTYSKLSGDWVTTSRLLPATTDRMLDEAANEGEVYLNNYKDQLQQQGIPVSVSILRGDTVDVISDAVSLNNINLIVMATHGTVGTEAFWLGSIMPKICANCKIPMLLIPVSTDKQI